LDSLFNAETLRTNIARRIPSGHSTDSTSTLITIWLPARASRTTGCSRN